jgi:hypothetical protein
LKFKFAPGKMRHGSLHTSIQTRRRPYAIPPWTPHPPAADIQIPGPMV